MYLVSSSMDIVSPLSMATSGVPSQDTVILVISAFEMSIFSVSSFCSYTSLIPIYESPSMADAASASSERFTVIV